MMRITVTHTLEFANWEDVPDADWPMVIAAASQKGKLTEIENWVYANDHGNRNHIIDVIFKHRMATEKADTRPTHERRHGDRIETTERYAHFFATNDFYTGK